MKAYYPRSMRKLPLEVHLKAGDIANALLKEGHDEAKAPPEQLKLLAARRRHAF